MHAGSVKDSDGDFGEWKSTGSNHDIIRMDSGGCNGLVHYRCWESSCGGYEDYQYKCEVCSAEWWVEGPDA